MTNVKETGEGIILNAISQLLGSADNVDLVWNDIKTIKNADFIKSN